VSRDCEYESADIKLTTHRGHLLTIIWGIALFFLLPDNIMTAKFFSTEEKALLVARSQTNRTGVYNQKIKMSQVKEALMDGQVWLLFLFVLLNEGINGGMI
jgi:hypothetical protein